MERKEKNLRKLYKTVEMEKVLSIIEDRKRCGATGDKRNDQSCIIVHLSQSDNHVLNFLQRSGCGENPNFYFLVSSDLFRNLCGVF